MNILDEYVLSLPSEQNILDIFGGEWSSKLPEKYGLHTKPGTAAGLFDDARVKWAEDVFGPFNGLDILELGPLEGGHSYMFNERGINSLTAIEANTRAFLKCLCIKEILALDNVHFKLGDFAKHLEQTEVRYDLIFACGVLYHMPNPISLLRGISGATDKVFLWTHYYDRDAIEGDKDLSRKFSSVEQIELDGRSYDCAIQNYQEALGWDGFCGGGESTSTWLTRESLIAALEDFGFSDLQFGFENKGHPNGPSFAVCASKK